MYCLPRKIGLTLLALMLPISTSAGQYLDDRSTLQKLIESFYNPINPELFATPPHQPIGIEDGHFEKTNQSLGAAASSLRLLERS